MAQEYSDCGVAENNNHVGSHGGKEKLSLTVSIPSDPEVGATTAIHDGALQRGLKPRHAQMMAFGGTVGTGLFVGSGEALAIAGPGFLFLAYALICVFVYGIVTATTEISSYLPTPGSTMASNGTRYASRSLGFAMGWLYWYSFAIIVAYEITAAGLVINYWPNNVPIAAWITIMLIVIVALNCFPVKVYGEAEFWFASLKVFMIIGLLILSVVLFFGGGPNHDRLGFRYWQNPGATKEYLVGGSAGRFCAFLYVLVFSVFSFNFAPELLVIAAGEMQSPRSNLPTAARRYFYRLLIFYVLGVLAIGVIVSSSNPKLLGGGAGATASPWVIAIKSAGISGLDSVINAIIITSAWSAGNSYLYMSTRTLYSLALNGNAPKIFNRCNRWGVPYAALAASSLFALLAYLNVSENSEKVFNWFINLTNTAGFTSWICCCVIFFRFRKACKAQNITDLPFKSPLQPYHAWISLVAFSILLLCNGFQVFFTNEWSTATFLSSYIGIPIFVIIYTVHRIVYRKDTWFIAPEDVDMTSGLAEVMMAELEKKQYKKVWYNKWRAVFG